MTVRRRFMFLAVTIVALWLAPTGFALPKAFVNDLFGPRLIRAEVLVQTPTGPVDYRIDRGIVTSSTTDSITLRELNGEMVTIQVAPDARIQGGGRLTVPQLARRRLRVTVIRDATGPVSTIQVEPGGTKAFVNDLFGARLIRAEVLVQTPTPVDYRIDRGIVTSSTTDSITLRELNGEMVTIQLAPGARIQGGGRLSVQQLARKRLRVTVIRDATGPVSTIQVEPGGSGR
jgi:autonomous glycyl radical cofactor GrcA